MAGEHNATLCILGCGNLGTAILNSLIVPKSDARSQKPLFTRFIACVRSEKSQKALEKRFSVYLDKLEVLKGENISAIQRSDVIILGIDPADVGAVLVEPGLADSLQRKLLISVVAGWTKQKLETRLYGDQIIPDKPQDGVRILRTLPNIAASVSQSITALEISEPAPSHEDLQLAKDIFRGIGRTVQLPPRLMNAATVVGGPTPAFFALICDALIDASVAVGLPREAAQNMIYQSMQGTSSLLQSGIHPGLLKDQGTSPAGCTIEGVMVLEEGAVRGHIGRALREAVKAAQSMEG